MMDLRPFTLSPDQPRRIEVAVDSMEIESDEDGWHLRIVDDDGWKYDFRFHGVAFEFAGSPGLQSLMEWRGEGESIRAEVRAARGELPRGEGYALSDPKHPDYHDVMSGLADDD